MNLCRWKDSSADVTTRSDVLGVSRSRRDVMCDAKGCKGFADL